MILHPLILFQVREFEMAMLFEVLSGNTLQFCAQLTATTYSSYRYLSCFLYNLMFWPPPLPPAKKTKQKQQQKTTKTKQSKKLTVYLYTDGNTDTHTLAPSSSFQSWGSQLALYHQSTRFLKYNLSATISVFPSLLDTAATSFRTGTAIISSNDRHHHNLSSLDNNNTGILYLLPKVSLMFI